MDLNATGDHHQDNQKLPKQLASSSEVPEVVQNTQSNHAGTTQKQAQQRIPLARSLAQVRSRDEPDQEQGDAARRKNGDPAGNRDGSRVDFTSSVWLVHQVEARGQEAGNPREYEGQSKTHGQDGD